MKTGALITASGVLGALAAETTPERVEAVRGYGQETGLAFQIVDDVLDATATSSELGKTAGKDARQQKASFAAFLGVDQAREAAGRHVRRAVDHLDGAGIDSTMLAALARFIVDRTS